MRVISKYLYIELLKPFLIFSFTFIGILWLVQILPKLETLVLNKQPIDIFFNVAFKPVATIMKDQDSIDSEGKKNNNKRKRKT